VLAGASLAPFFKFSPKNFLPFLPKSNDKKVSALLCDPLLSHEPNTSQHTMAPPNTRARANWAVQRATALPEVWALVAKHRGVLGARRLMRVCRAARAGGLEYLRTLPGLVVCGGVAGSGIVSDALRLDLATLRWVPMPALVTTHYSHACCAVSGTRIVLGGVTMREGDLTSSVERLSSSEEGGAFVDLPPMSCGAIAGAAAVVVDESDSAAGQVLLIGGGDDDIRATTTVQLVDLATGACAPQSNLLHRRAYPAAGRLPNGPVVCAGGVGGEQSSAEVWGAPAQGAADAPWSWTELPAMSVGRDGCCGCVMSDGRFAVLGGKSSNFVPKSSCEALVVDDGDAHHWEPLPPMHDSRVFFACGAVAGCVIVAGGTGRKSAEVYDEELNGWLQLPCDLPYDGGLRSMGSAVLYKDAHEYLNHAWSRGYMPGHDELHSYCAHVDS
jgi:hypothetical protein